MYKKILFVLFIICSIVSAERETCDKGLSANMTEYSRASFILTLLNHAGSFLEDAKRYASAKISCAESQPQCEKPMDCFDIYESNPTAKSGIHKIWPRNRLSSNAISVYCDMSDEGGAWTVIQRRGNFDSDKDYFYRNWEDYKKGFGKVQKDFWLGNDNIFALTNQRLNSVKFTLADWEGNSTYATYDEFWIDDEINNYTMHVKGYRGTAGDSFSGTNGVPFTTKDRDNDTYDKNCAVVFKGAWWYTACHSSNLNGLYLKGAHESYADSVVWHSFRGHHYSLKDTVIKIRPKSFKTVQLDVTPQ